MAKKDQEEQPGGEKAAQAEEAPPTQIEKQGKTAYSVERLMTDGAGLVGYGPHVIAGALHGVDADYLTPDEVRQHVDKWLSKEDSTQASSQAEG